MKVKRLIKELKKLDPKAIVLLSGDAEGNDHMDLDIIESELVVSKDGDVGPGELTPELESYGWTKGDIIKGKPCIVFFP